MSTIVPKHETEVWTSYAGYLMNLANLALNDTCAQITMNDASSILHYTGATCYLLAQWSSLTPLQPFTESWTTDVWLPLFVARDVKLSSLDSSQLNLSRRLVESFSADLRGIAEAVLYNLEDDPDRPPGFIIEIIAVIPDSDRDSEHKIYAALGKLMRENTKLLIDLHIVKRRGRQIKEVVPPEYQGVLQAN